MRAEFQALTGVIRGGPEYQKFGDPYSFVCTVQIYGDVAHVVGAVSGDGGFSITARSSINDALWMLGVREVTWERAHGKVIKGRLRKPKCVHGSTDPTCYFCTVGE